MELKLKDHYMDICGKKKSPSDAEDDDSDDDESDSEELEAYDGFAGTVEETPVIDVTQRQKRQRTDNDSFVCAIDLISVARSIVQV